MCPLSYRADVVHLRPTGSALFPSSRGCVTVRRCYYLRLNILTSVHRNHIGRRSGTLATTFLSERGPKRVLGRLSKTTYRVYGTVSPPDAQTDQKHPKLTFTLDAVDFVMNVTSVHRVETLRSPVQQLAPRVHVACSEMPCGSLAAPPAESREPPASSQVLLWLLSLMETC